MLGRTETFTRTRARAGTEYATAPAPGTPCIRVKTSSKPNRKPNNKSSRFSKLSSSLFSSPQPSFATQQRPQSTTQGRSSTTTTIRSFNSHMQNRQRGSAQASNYQLLDWQHRQPHPKHKWRCSTLLSPSGTSAISCTGLFFTALRPSIRTLRLANPH